MVHKPEEPSEVEISPPEKPAEQDKIASDEDTLPDIEPKEASPSTGELEISQKEDVNLTKEEETLIADELKTKGETPEASKVADDLQHEELPAQESIELPQVYCLICLLLQ